MTAGLAYLDASAFVKLAVTERESPSLRRFLRDWPVRASCSILRTEAVRAIRRSAIEAIQVVREELDRVDLIPIDDELLQTAAALTPESLRTLDALHLAAALRLAPDLGVMVTYDRRMTEAARALGISVDAPE
ncbi:hypothetical protein BH20CHL6_BH20CHL6_14880 [soil metagenome]